LNAVYIPGSYESVPSLFGTAIEVTRREWAAQMLANDQFLQPEGQMLDSILGRSGKPRPRKPG